MSMKPKFSFLSLVTIVGLLAVGAQPVEAASAKAGSACTTLGKSAAQGAFRLKCTKVGKKLVWVAVSANESSSGNSTVNNSPAPTSTPSPSATETLAAPASNVGEAWTNSKFVKPSSSSAVSAAASAAFEDYVATNRWPDDKVVVWAETGSDPTVVTWVSAGASLVATTFEKPKSIGAFNDVISVTREYLVSTFTKLYSADMANNQAGAWDAGSPAWGGRTSNGWSMPSIIKNKSLTNDRAGIAQTAGHEYFHAIQENFANARGTNCGACGTPQWFWEGPAMFVGLETSSHLKFVSYQDGRQTMVNRVSGSPTAKLLLSQVKDNTPPSVDPYGIGEIATEFLVANVGMKKFVDIYRKVGTGLPFDLAFQIATGVPLNDFYLMFEDSRAALGIPQAK